MFSKFFKKDEPKSPSAPEIMGLRLGGAFELDQLRLRLIEPSVIFEGAAKTQLIQAVGQVQLDASSTLLRFYTDDDGFIQVVLNGGMTENHVEDVKLWYFYETRAVGSQADWDMLINSQISQPEYSIEGHRFQRVWESVGEASPPVAMTEKTTTEAGEVTETDQFAMLYERSVNEDLDEFLMVCGEEKIIDNRADRCLVLSTGINLRPADIVIIG
ncbi:YjfK family protein [Hahella aquimaris]|uniref:YjfK family protein n=1 Tax=Hahella sp. HNIBRBA332 TaxID=3015983 RepID=UPI00273BCD4B|nr:YjfK family protein [Hahella sp. HNIBRBA332]WLQ13505.1 YjfK family protein [Hahella sp. HNIBRBA332]